MLAALTRGKEREEEGTNSLKNWTSLAKFKLG